MTNLFASYNKMTSFTDQGKMVDAIYFNCSKAFNAVRKYSQHTSWMLQSGWMVN